MREPSDLGTVLLAHGGAIATFSSIFSGAGLYSYVDVADRLCGLIADDLSALGIQHSVQPVPFSPTFDENALGFAYVLIGSRLGSKQIAADLRGSSQISSALSYFSDQQAIQHWTDLTERLDKVPPDLHPAVIRGADCGFSLFTEALSALAPDRTSL